jgi:hypothetical protein
MIFCLPGSVPAQSSPPIWSATVTYKQGDIVNAPDGNSYKCIAKTDSKHPDPRNGYSFWELYDLETGPSLTLSIGRGQTFPNLVTAWKYIRDARISQGVSLYLSIVNPDTTSVYSESLAGSFSLNHPYGSSISIFSPDPKRAVLNFGTSSGFTVDSGHSFGMVSGVTLNGSKADYSNGVLATNLSTISLTNVIIQNFPYAIHATLQGNVNLGAKVMIQHFGFVGVLSETNSVVTSNSPIALDGANLSALGFAADLGGLLVVPSCTASNFNGPNGGVGFKASRKGLIVANGASASNCVYGFQAEQDGSIQATRSSATNCKVGGWSATLRSYIYSLNQVTPGSKTVVDSTSVIFQ